MSSKFIRLFRNIKQKYSNLDSATYNTNNEKIKLVVEQHIESPISAHRVLSTPPPLVRLLKITPRLSDQRLPDQLSNKTCRRLKLSEIDDDEVNPGLFGEKSNELVPSDPNIPLLQKSRSSLGVPYYSSELDKKLAYFKKDGLPRLISPMSCFATNSSSSIEDLWPNSKFKTPSNLLIGPPASESLAVKSSYQQNELQARSQVQSVLTMPSEITPSSNKFGLDYFNFKTSISKLTNFTNWFFATFLLLFIKGYNNIKSLMSIATRKPKPKPLPRFVKKEMNQIIAVIKGENDRSLSILTNKILDLSNRVDQIQETTETALTSLMSSMHYLQTVNDEILMINKNLINETKSLKDEISKVKATAVPVATTNFAASIPSSQAQSFKIPPPPPLPPNVSSIPPPPPPPPPPMPIFEAPTKSINSNTSNNSESKCKTSQKSSITDRPAITVEDLLTVRLRKAPREVQSLSSPKTSPSLSRSFNQRRNTIPCPPRGPIISIDMLRNVKLKSARQRSIDQLKSSPRVNRRRQNSNRSESNISLSPILSDAESSLLRLLKPVNIHQRVLKRMQSLPSVSNPLLEELECESDSVFYD